MTKPANAQRASPAIVATNDDAAVVLPLTTAARIVGHSYTALKREIESDDPRIRHLKRRAHGRGNQILVRLDEIREDLNLLPSCPVPGCEEPGLGVSGHCGEHFAQGGRERAQEAENDLFAGKRDWWSVTEATNRAGGRVSRTRIQQAADRREFPSQKVGRVRRIPKEPFLSWLRTQPRRGPRKPTREESEMLRQRVVELHSKSLGRAEIGEKLGLSRQAVSTMLDRSGIERQGRGRDSGRRPPGEREARKQRTAAAYRDGMSSRDIARQLASSQSQVLRDLAELGEEIRPPRRAAKSPPAEERPCAFCGDRFTPRAPVFRSQRFCCPEHWKAARAQAPLDALANRGLLATDDLGLPGIGQHEVLVHIKAGDLKAELVEVPGGLRAVYGVAPEERNRFAREFSRKGDGRRRVMEDPKQLLSRWRGNGMSARLLSTGHTPDEVRALARDAAERRRRYFAPLRRTGRPRSGAPSERDLRWLERFEELADERAYHAERVALGVVAKSDGEAWDEAMALADASDSLLFRMVARADWREHPDCWSRVRYPPSRANPGEMRADMVGAAGRVVGKAVKRLQTAGTKSPAADFLSY